MVKKGLAAVGGTIRVYSTENVGTRFVITLPPEPSITVADVVENPG
jgi:chemotaxis protein histidine kinase CheA